MNPRRISIGHFLRSNCESVNEFDKFIDNWLESNGNPCTSCVGDKTKCDFHKKT